MTPWNTPSPIHDDPEHRNLTKADVFWGLVIIGAIGFAFYIAL